MRMELVFLGTRGEIPHRTRRHRRHSALLVKSGRARILIDCGADWLGRLERLELTAIVITHGHPDHAGGLADGAPCPVYATADTWSLLSAYPLSDRRVMPLRRPIAIGGVRLEAFPVDHSIRAPAVGYRIVHGGARVFYVPDVVAIRDHAAALRSIDLYIGDGATLTRPLIRRRGAVLIGHTPIRTQLGWCGAEGVPRAVFTHCGSEIVAAEGRRLAGAVRRLGRERGVQARLAYDGFRLALRTAGHARRRRS
jgi:phosphoribosyl 1,2-cyclic phosphodiesterase